MVQLNPFKWGSKKRKENLKVESLKKSIEIGKKLGGRSGANKSSKARKELNKMGHLTDKQKAQKDQKDRKAYDKEHKIVNKRGRVTGYKEGYDPSKGVQKKTKTNSSSKSTSTDKAAWLKKTKNSPAAKAGLSADQRWAAYQRSQKKKK